MARHSSRETTPTETPRRTRRNLAGRRAGFRPNYENLEARITLTAKVWSGALDSLWTQGANWTDGVAPASGDDLVFPASATRLAAANDFASGTTFGSITVGSPGYDLTGNAITLSGGVSATYGSGTSFDEIDTTFAAGGAPVSVSPGGELDVLSVLAGSGGLTLTGGGTLLLGGINANTYAGATTVDAGSLLLNKTAGVAVAGDLVIGDGSGSVLVQLLSANQTVASRVVTVNSSGAFDLNGHDDTVGGLTMTGGTVATGSGTLYLGGDVTVNAGTATSTIGGHLDLNGADRTFTLAAGTAPGGVDLVVPAIVSSTTGGIIKAGAGLLSLSADNTYTGYTFIGAGTVAISKSLSLGSTGSGTTVAPGATLQYDGTINNSSEPIAVGGTGVDGLGAIVNASGNNVAGTLTLSADATISVPTGSMLVATAIGDGGSSYGLTKTGTGRLIFQGTNTYSGTTNVSAGGILLAAVGGNALSGPLVVGDGTATTARVSYLYDGQIADGSSVVLNGPNTVLDLGGRSDTVGALTVLGGTVTKLSGGGGLTVSDLSMTGGLILFGVSTTFTVNGDVTINAAPNGTTGSRIIGPATPAGNLDLGGVTRTFTVARATSGSGPDLDIATVITGAGGVTKAGAGSLRLEGANTYTGPTTVDANGGTLIAANASALGDTGSGTTVNAASTLAVDGGITLAAEPINFLGNPWLLSTGGDNDVTGPITFPSGNMTVAATTGTRLTLSGPIAGDWSPDIYFGSQTNDGTVVLSGNNTFNNYVDVHYGTLVLASDTALGSPANGVYQVLNGATLALQAGVTVADPINNLSGNGVGGLGALLSLGGSNVYGGPIGLSGNATVGVGAGTLDVTGAVSGGGLTKTGAGTLILGATETYAGGTTVAQGTLLADGDLSSSPSVQVQSGATLGGSGTVGTVDTAGGSLAPGDSPNVIHTGAVNLDGSSTLAEELDGATPGNGVTGYDQVDASGAISLGGATLSVTIGGGYLPASGDKLTVIRNGSGLPISGTFAGLPEGSIFDVSGSSFLVSYIGGGGNDVTLTYMVATSTTVSSSQAVASYGDQLTFTAMVTSGGGTPTGTVFFYDGPVGPATLLGSVAVDGLGTAAFTTGSLTASAAPYAITAVYQGSTPFESSSASPYSQTVNKAVLTFTADPQTRKYGDANPILTSTVTGFKNGETLATSDVTGASDVRTTATPTSPVAGSPYSITASPGTLASGNYAFSFVDGQFAVTPAPLTVTADSQSKTYGDALPTLTATYTGFKNGETLATSDVTGTPALATTATAFSHVLGSPYVVTAAAGTLSSGNYSLTFVDGQLTVTAAALTVTANDATKVYGSALPVLTVNYRGFVNGDTSASLTTQPVATTSATASSHLAGSPYAVSASAAVDPDYTISYVGGQLTVTPAPLTVTANDATKVYGSALPPLSASYSGFVNGDTSASLTTPPTLSTTATAASHVAGSPYAVSASAAVDPDYTISYVGGQLTVTPAPLTVTANDATKVYGSALPVLTVNYSGFVNGDTSASLTTPPTLSTAATAGSGVAGSPYAITASGAADPDYAVSYVDGQLAVTPVALTVTANDATKVYGAALPPLSASYIGFVNGDTSASLTTPPTLSTTATPTSPVAGSPYAVTASGAADPDYTIGYVGGLLDVTQAATTVALASSAAPAVYGQAVTFTASVAVNSPGSGIPTGTVTFSDGTAVLGTVPLSGGAATLTTSALGAGAHAVTAVYNGDAEFSASPAAASPLTVGRATPDAFLYRSNVSANPGQTVYFTTAVTPTGPTAASPTGIVMFYDGSTPFNWAYVVNGQATVATTFSSGPGTTHLVTGIYFGDANFAPSVSQHGTVVEVAPYTSTTTTLRATPQHLPGGLAGANLVVVVSPATPGAGVATGTVTFTTRNGRAWRSAALVNGRATAFASHANLVGRTFVAHYGGDATHAPSVSPSLVYGKNFFQSSVRAATALSRRGLTAPRAFGRQG